MAKREKKPVHKVVMTEGKRNIIQQLLQEYDIETAEDIQDALKDLLGGNIKEMMKAEMDEHLGCGKLRDIKVMTSETVINLRWLTAVMDRLALKFLRTVSLILKLRLLKSVRRIFLVLFRRLYLCMQKE